MTAAENSPGITWTLVKTADGQAWRGVVTMPAAPGTAAAEQGKMLKVTGKKAKTKDQALQNVAKTAQKALSNPILQAVLPPGVGPALKILATPKVAKAVVKHGKTALRLVSRFLK